jgi:hypothetical protein
VQASDPPRLRDGPRERTEDSGMDSSPYSS